MSEALTLALILVRAEEAWEPVLFGGMIPIIGALAVLYIIVRAVRDNPENDELENDDDPKIRDESSSDAEKQTPPS
jgi:hypothetical protein